eukprot:jgi/Botrbrau1/4740/Bobra.0137s0012.1
MISAGTYRRGVIDEMYSVLRFSSVALLLFLSACTHAARIKKEEPKPHRVLFKIEGPDELAHMLGGLMESQHNHQFDLRESDDPLGKMLSELTAPLVAAHAGLMKVESFLADPLSLENSGFVKDLAASLEPNEQFQKSFAQIVRSSDPADAFMQKANEIWEPAINDLLSRETNHPMEHELAEAFGITDLFEKPSGSKALIDKSSDVSSMSILDDDGSKTIKISKKALLDKIAAKQTEKKINIDLRETYVPSDKTLAKIAKINKIVDKLAAKVNKTKHKPPLPEKKTDPLLKKWQKFWGNKKFQAIKAKIEEKNNQGII